MIGLDDTRAGMLRVERLNVTLSAGAVAASYAFLSPTIATSVAAGAAVEVLNFRALHGAARAFFAGELGGGGVWMGFFGLRMGVIAGAIAVATAFGANPIAFAVGLSILLPALIVDSWRHRPAIIDQSDYPVPDPDDPSWDDFSVWRIERADSDDADDAQAVDEEEVR